MKRTEKAAFFPLFVDLSKKKVVVIGAGKIACRRIGILAEFVGQIKVVAPEINEGIKAMVVKWPIEIQKKCYDREDLYSADMVIAATDDERLNGEIYGVCKSLGILVNVVSDKNKCDFHFPGIVKTDELVVGINAGGRDHRLVRETREKIEGVVQGGRG